MYVVAMNKASSSEHGVTATSLINNWLLNLNKSYTSSIITSHKCIRFLVRICHLANTLFACFLWSLFTKTGAQHKNILKENRGNSSASRNGNDCCSDYHPGLTLKKKDGNSCEFPRGKKTGDKFEVMRIKCLIYDNLFGVNVMMKRQVA